MPIILASPQEVEAEAGESLQSGVQPGLHSKTLSPKENRKGLPATWVKKRRKM